MCRHFRCARLPVPLLFSHSRGLANSAATRIAFLIALAFDRPWQMMQTPFTPSSGAPPSRSNPRACGILVGCLRKHVAQLARHGGLQRFLAACCVIMSTKPSLTFSATLPMKPSHTTTSAMPPKMSRPSTLPMKLMRQSFEEGQWRRGSGRCPCALLRRWRASPRAGWHYGR